VTDPDRAVTWIASYPRSGNTWTRSLLHAYLTDREIGSAWLNRDFTAPGIHRTLGRLRDRAGDEDAVWGSLVEQSRPEVLREIGVIAKTHFCFSREHPLAGCTARAVLVVRNPRDVLLSSLNFHGLFRSADTSDPAKYAREFIALGGDRKFMRSGYGTWHEHAKSWLGAPFPIIVLRYERMLSDTLGELEKLVRFLDLPFDPSKAALAVERARSGNLKDSEEKVLSSGRFRPADPDRRFFNFAGSGQSLDQLAPGLDRDFDTRFGPLTRDADDAILSNEQRTPISTRSES
jgi:hypothetical protein